MSKESEARRQRLADGKAALDEAAMLARNLYEALPRDKEKHAAVDRKFGELCGWN